MSSSAVPENDRALGAGGWVLCRAPLLPGSHRGVRGHGAGGLHGQSQAPAPLGICDGTSKAFRRSWLCRDGNERLWTSKPSRFAPCVSVHGGRAELLLVKDAAFQSG